MSHSVLLSTLPAEGTRWPNMWPLGDISHSNFLYTVKVLENASGHHRSPLGYRIKTRPNNCVQGLLGRTTFCFPQNRRSYQGSALDWVITLSQIGLSPPPQQGFEPASLPDSSTGPRKNHLTYNRQTFSVCSTALFCKVLQENHFRTVPSYHWCGSWGRSVCETCRETRL